jgi:hypothetical protein
MYVLLYCIIAFFVFFIRWKIYGKEIQDKIKPTIDKWGIARDTGNVLIDIGLFHWVLWPSIFWIPIIPGIILWWVLDKTIGRMFTNN